MMKSLIAYLASKPFVLDFLRRVLEANHKGEKKVIMNELTGSKGLVLDLGCGTGVFSPLLGSEYVGIDVSPLYIAYAKKKYRKEFKVMSAEHLEFPGAHFDAIFMNGVLHHLGDRAVQAIVGEMRRVLKPSGKAIVMEDVPATTFISKIIRGLDIGDHIRAADAYRGLLSEHFTVLKQYPVRTGVCDYEVFVLG